jgi:hypothetical protein
MSDTGGLTRAKGGLVMYIGELFLYFSVFSRFFSTFPQTPAAHLRTLCVTPVCRGTPVENRCSMQNKSSTATQFLTLHRLSALSLYQQ